MKPRKQPVRPGSLGLGPSGSLYWHRYPFEAAVDGLDGAAEAAFSAFPSRVFVIDARGAVTFSSALDVESFRPEALEVALEAATRQ